MAELLHRAASEAALLDAWREVQENDLAVGKVNPRVAAYADRQVIVRDGRVHALAAARGTS